MEVKIQYHFSAKIWQHNAPGGWHFTSVPNFISKEIRENLKWQEEGWGRMKAIAEIGSKRWETAIWFDTKRNTYILPIKAEIRKKLNLTTNDMIHLTIWV
ncbi:DUF1905 domain-containing protein [Gaetbulibacter saemankumensis]|uniref:DUF1905 domain-containing protein n=1 Tax=Gaetbulibacter saemankumensis TaxID=311208 RepID=UPI000422E817|nr:DUF1905 domain-containing protein [Gaetbulibacter saemankumensis]